jgi:hypothetical protein
MIVLPFTSSFGMLVTGRLVQLLALGCFIAAVASLIVYLIRYSAELTKVYHVPCAGLHDRVALYEQLWCTGDRAAGPAAGYELLCHI